MLPAEIVTSSAISCAPTGPMPPGKLAVAVTDNGVDFVDADEMITFLPGTTVTAVSPSSGPFAGSAGRGRLPILLTGTGFSAIDRPSCSFGEVVVDAQEVISATEARCIPPVMPRSAGLSTPLSVSVRFSNNGVDFGDCEDETGGDGGGDEPMFLFYDEPVVTSVTPARGATNGQESTVVLVGSNLAQEGSNRVAETMSTLMCRLGKDGFIPTANGAILSSTDATCVVSCGDFSGVTSFEVSLNDGADWTASDVPFRCDPIPTISSVSPEIGPTTGGTTLTVKGSGFVSSESLSCVIGEGDENSTSTVVKAQWISSSAVSCVTPGVSGAFGPTTADVAVTNDGINFSPPADATSFTYVSPPMVTRVTPSFASVFGDRSGSPGDSGSVTVTATGTNFIDSPLSSCHFTPLVNNSTEPRVGADVEFGTRGSVHVSATFLSSTEVYCQPDVGILPVGPAMLTVSVNGVDFDNTAGAVIELEALPEVLKVVPARGMTGPTSTPVEVRFERALLTRMARDCRRGLCSSRGSNSEQNLRGVHVYPAIRYQRGKHCSLSQWCSGTLIDSVVMSRVSLFTSVGSYVSEHHCCVRTTPASLALSTHRASSNPCSFSPQRRCTDQALPIAPALCCAASGKRRWKHHSRLQA